MRESSENVNGVQIDRSADEVGTFVALVHGAALVHKTKSTEAGGLPVRTEPPTLRVNAVVDGSAARYEVTEHWRVAPVTAEHERHDTKMHVGEAAGGEAGDVGNQ